MVLRQRRRGWLSDCTRTQQASQHTYSSLCFYTYCLVLVVALFYTSPLQLGDLTPRPSTISQYAWGATCPWSGDSHHDECMGCGNLAGPPPASTELCAVRCGVTWVQFDEGKATADIEVQLVTAGAVHSEEQLRQVTVQVHESFGAPGNGSISQITLTREGTPQLVWAGEDNTGCAGVLTATGFTAIEGSYPKAFDGLTLRVRRVTTAGQLSHPALAAVHITSPPASALPTRAVTTLHLLVILVTAGLMGMQYIVHHAASTHPYHLRLATTTEDITKALGTVAAGFGVLTMIVPSNVPWSEAAEYMQVHYHLWLGIISGCLVVGLAGVHLGRAAVQGTRDAKAAGHHVTLASQLCTFDLGGNRAASMWTWRCLSVGCVAMMAVWRVMRHRLSLSTHLHIAIALSWLCWLWLSRRELVYVVAYFTIHRKQVLTPAGAGDDDASEGGGRRKLFRPTSLSRLQLEQLRRFQIRLRMMRRSRRGGGMVTSLRAAVRHMSVHQLTEEEVKHSEISHVAGYRSLVNTLFGSNSPSSGEQRTHMLPGSGLDTALSSVHAIQALVPLLGREQATSSATSTPLTRGCGVMIPLVSQEPSCLPSPLPASWRSTTCEVHGVSPAPLIPLRHAKVPLARSSVEWASITRYLLATLGTKEWKGLEVASIERVQNPVLWQRYRSRVKELRADLANAQRCLAHGESGTIAEPQLAAMVEGHRELLLWHGTSATAVDSICEAGFRPQVTTRAALGPGCYFGLRSETAMNYAKDKHGIAGVKRHSSRGGSRATHRRRLKLVLSVVAAGVEVKGDRGRRDRHNRSYDNYVKGLLVDVAVDSSCDSIPYGSDVSMKCPTMMCVMDGRQVYPAFVVTVMV